AFKSRRTTFAVFALTVAVCGWLTWSQWMQAPEPHEPLFVAEIWTAGPEASGYTIADCPVQDAGSLSGRGAYGDPRRWDFLVRPLHGIEPPERNAVREAAAGQ